MKQIRVFLILFVALGLVLPLESYAQSRRSPRSEIRIINGTDTQISFYITTEKYGRKQWTWAPNKSSYPTIDGIRLRVRGTDEIEIADWGKAQIKDLATFNDGVWLLSLRLAGRELRNR